MNLKFDKVYHLSHIDLDGYSCQLVTKKVFNNIEFFNSNYGEEIEERLSQIIYEIEKTELKKNLILITDLNLSLELCEYLEKSIKEIEDKDVEILLLDHHKTGNDSAEKYKWYNLDISRSASLLTYDYFKNTGLIDDLKYYIECVNAYDIWLQDKKTEFEIGKVLARYVMNAKEINRVMFSKENFEYISYILQQTYSYFKQDDVHIKLDDDMHSIKKSFFQKNYNNTLENLVSDYLVELLTQNKDNMTLFYKDKKGILTYSIGNSSIIGNAFLRRNPEYDFFIDINSRKNISMRADNKVDVSLIAKELFNGGGHANASGGKYKEFQDSFIYEKIRKQMEEIMI